MDSKPAAHPEHVARDTYAAILSLSPTSDEQVAFKKLVEASSPPPSASLLKEMAIGLNEVGLMSDTERALICRFSERTGDEAELARRHTQKQYPVPYALKRLIAAGSNHVKNRDWAISFLLQLVKESPIKAFSGHVFYKQTISFRDVVIDYWRSLDRLEPGSREPATQENLAKFIDRQRASPLIAQHTLGKYEIADALLCGELPLGQRQRRGTSGKRRRGSIGTAVALTPEYADEITAPEILLSAEVGEPYMDDDGLSAPISHHEYSSRSDRYRVNRKAENGFARRNTPTTADMNICSEATFRDFLSWAYEEMPASEYALTWLHAFSGLDLARPIRKRVRNGQIPKDDEILLSTGTATLEYHVLRRIDKDDPEAHESAGINTLPLPQFVSDGISKVLDCDALASAIAGCRKAATRFSRHHPGLTPTPHRLRASSAVHVRYRSMTMLESCAIAGRVQPALKGLSAYYPADVSRTARKFAAAYREATHRLKFSAPDLDLGSFAPANDRRVLFSLARIETDAVSALLDALAHGYQEATRRIESLGLLCVPEDVLNAVNLHETARYVIQQYSLGVRPIGEVAKASFAGKRGAIIIDKKSRLFLERSFTPLSDSQLNFLRCSNRNRAVLAQYLRNIGKSVEHGRGDFDLACTFLQKNPKQTIVKNRLTNAYFRHEAPVASELVDRNFKHNWLRHASIRQLAGKVQQWIADEFFGHRRIGREPLSSWSTAGISHFEAIRSPIDDWLEPILPEALMQPIEVQNVSIEAG